MLDRARTTHGGEPPKAGLPCCAPRGECYSTVLDPWELPPLATRACREGAGVRHRALPPWRRRASTEPGSFEGPVVRRGHEPADVPSSAPDMTSPIGPSPRLALVLSCLAVCSSCSRSEAAERTSTRGLVVAVQGEGDDLRVAIHHERIPAFKDREGQRAPMPSMIMLFGLGPGLHVSELVPGVKLALTFEVHWTTSPTLVITHFRRLPADTPLALSSAH